MTATLPSFSAHFVLSYSITTLKLWIPAYQGWTESKTLGNFYFSFSWDKILKISVFFRKVFKQFKVNWNLYAKTLPWPGDYFLHENESWPILFLYSNADKVVKLKLMIERIQIHPLFSSLCRLDLLSLSLTDKKALAEQSFLTNLLVHHTLHIWGIFQKNTQRLFQTLFRTYNQQIPKWTKISCDLKV